MRVIWMTVSSAGIMCQGSHAAKFVERLPREEDLAKPCDEGFASPRYFSCDSPRWNKLSPSDLARYQSFLGGGTMPRKARLRTAIYARVSTKDKDQDPDTQLYPLRDSVSVHPDWEIRNVRPRHLTTSD